MSSAASSSSQPNVPPNAAAPSVFLSYSPADSEWKERIAKVLSGRGIEVWDNSRPASRANPQEESQWAIENARVAVLLISPRYLTPEITQGQEFQRLLKRGKPLFTVLIDDCDWQRVAWPAGSQVFPADGLSLATLDAGLVESYLALAALEIGSLAGVVSPVAAASVKVSQPGGSFLGMATLVSNHAAIGIFPNFTNLGILNLEFPGTGTVPVSGTAQATRFSDDPRLTLLKLVSPVEFQVPISTIPPTPGSAWECFSFVSATDRGVFTTGMFSAVVTRDGREYLQLKPSMETNEARGMSGAPIVFGGQVVAILENQGAILDEWFAISLQSITSSAIWTEVFPTAVPSTSKAAGSSVNNVPAPSAGASAAFDAGNFVSRLTPESLTALLRAEGFRLALGQKKMHMEHLLLGLYGQVDSPIRRLARDARIYDEASFQRSLSSANPSLNGNVVPVPPATPITLPDLSAHVRAAFVAALEIGGRRIGRSSLLQGAMSVDCSVLRGLRNAAPSPQKSEGSVGQRDWIIGVTSDVPGKKEQDLLDLERDVNALCSVIAARDAALPLSIALFGEWGSGKSFFMNMMEQRLDDLQKAGPPYCSEIIQLKFNAWHYIDTSLWASLTAEIFEGLATELSKRSTLPEPVNNVAKLLKEVSTSRDRLVEAEQEREAAKIKLAGSEARLQELAGSEAQVRASLSPGVLFKEATRLAFEQKEVKKEFEKAARELNLQQAVDSGAEVNNELLELRGIFRAMVVAMRNTERLGIWILALAFVVLAVFGIPLLAHTYLPEQWGLLKASITTAATLFAAVAAFLGPFFVPAKRALKYLQQAREKSDELVRVKRQEKFDELTKESGKWQDEVARQEQAVEQEQRRLAKLEEAVEQLRAGRQMFDFIKRRNESTDYTAHRGVVAHAHKDFKELNTFLSLVAKEPEEKGLPRVDRIVLYIDDLDRCPEDKVMQVLQAVHLLLAFSLFVVVVGVDPRWLLRSVAASARPLRDDGAEPNDWGHATPLDYLEKIFQIPFTLRPMSAHGFGSLVDTVAAGSQVEEKKIDPPPGTATASAVKSPDVVDQAQTQTETVVVPQAGPTPALSRPTQTAVPKPPLETSKTGPALLKIEPWEREFMKKLYILIPSPRAGKRFINIYRMIRSTVEPEYWQRFVGDAQQGGEHRQALLLLAMLTGYPGEAAEILRRLIERVHNETWWEFIESLGATSGHWAELHLKLQSLRPLIADTEGCDTFRRYAPWVARYSFQSGRVLLAQHLPETDT